MPETDNVIDSDRTDKSLPNVLGRAEILHIKPFYPGGEAWRLPVFRKSSAGEPSPFTSLSHCFSAVRAEMNDLGLDDAIDQNAKKVTREIHEDEEVEANDEQTFLKPSRWWFASTAFPLLAGTFGPMASAFSVCALVQSWRVIVPPDGAKPIEQKDPQWLLAINAISLALALTSNLCLLLNMARRISFSVAQPITIIGWYFASVLLMALVCVTEVHLKFPADQVRDLTQAFYYAIIAAILYFMIATLMVFTVCGAYRGEYPKEFELTISQRTLMLQTISYMVYLLGGAAIFAKVERWKFADAVYWANFTLLTVGIGDFVPVTHLGRSLLFPYGIGGIVILGLVIGSIRSMVLERGKKKLGSRMIEKKRERVLKKIHKNGEAKKLTPVSSEQKAQELGMSERERRKEEFLLMRKIQKKASQKQKWTALLISSWAWFFLWLMGAFAFYKFEFKQGWTYFQSLYFAYTSLLAIGYGDFSPASNPGKPFFVFWSLLAVPTLTILISNMGDTVIAGIRDLTIYLGEFTVLPGEASIKDRLKQHASKVTQGKAFSKASGPTMDDPPGVMGVGEKFQDEDQEKGSNNNHLAHAAATDHMAKFLEKEELAEASAAADRGDRLSSDIHMYHFLLIKELRNVMKHVNEKPPRKYSYEEWTWYLKLIGEDESASSTHRKAPIQVETNDEKGMMQQGGAGGQTRQGKNDAAGDEEKKQEGWSWVGTRSPLMGEIEEAEWILERLSATLESELRKQHKERRRERLGGGDERRKLERGVRGMS